MAEIHIGITVFPAEVPLYKNEYTEKNAQASFDEIRIDPVYCVYRRWNGESLQG